MKYNLFFLVLFPLLMASSIVPQRVMKKADKAISKFYDIEHLNKEVISVSEEHDAQTPSRFGPDNFFKVIHNEDFKGYAYIGNAPSKTATFDYLVLFDENFVVTKSKVLIYREEYGGEIGSKRWLKQFSGKKHGDIVKHGQDIVAIAGATISTRSMTRAMNELFESIRILNTKGVL